MKNSIMIEKELNLSIHLSDTIPVHIKEINAMAYISKDKLTLHDSLNLSILSETSIPPHPLKSNIDSPQKIYLDTSKKQLIAAFSVKNIPQSGDKFIMFRFSYQEGHKVDYLDTAVLHMDDFYKFIQTHEKNIPKRPNFLSKSGFDVRLNALHPSLKKNQKIFSFDKYLKKHIEGIKGVLTNFKEQGDRNLVFFSSKNLLVVKFDPKNKKILRRKTLLIKEGLPDSRVNDFQQFLYYEKLDKAFFSCNYRNNIAVVQFKNAFNSTAKTKCEKLMKISGYKVNLIKQKNYFFVFPFDSGLKGKIVCHEIRAKTGATIKKYRHLSKRFYYSGFKREPITHIFRISEGIFNFASRGFITNYLTQNESILIQTPISMVSPDNRLVFISSEVTINMSSMRDYFFSIFRIDGQKISFVYELNQNHFSDIKEIKSAVPGLMKFDKIRHAEFDSNNDLLIWMCFSDSKSGRVVEGILLVGNDQSIEVNFIPANIAVKGEGLIHLIERLGDDLFCLHCDKEMTILRFRKANRDFLVEGIYDITRIKKASEKEKELKYAYSYDYDESSIYSFKTTVGENRLSLTRHNCQDSLLSLANEKYWVDESLATQELNNREAIVKMSLFGDRIAVVWNYNSIVKVEVFSKNKEFEKLSSSLFSPLPELQMNGVVFYDQNTLLVGSGDNNQKVTFLMLQNNSFKTITFPSKAPIYSPWVMKKGRQLAFEWSLLKILNESGKVKMITLMN